jgi:hypothetical protein
MTTVLSDKPRSFLRDNHLTVFSIINREGSSQLTTVLYALNDDEMIVMNVERNSQKAKNMRRDLERLGLLSLFLTGEDEAKRDDAANMIAQQRVSVRFKTQKVTERLG